MITLNLLELPVFEQLPVWTKASFADYFKTVADAANLLLTIDSVDNATAMEQSNYINLRIPGPDILPISANQIKIMAGIEILLHNIIDPKYLYTTEVFKGQITDALLQCIPLKQSGYSDSTQQIVDYFQLQRVRNPVRTLQLVNIDQTSRAVETVFTASYEVILQGDF